MENEATLLAAARRILKERGTDHDACSFEPGTGFDCDIAQLREALKPYDEPERLHLCIFEKTDEVGRVSECRACGRLWLSDGTTVVPLDRETFVALARMAQNGVVLAVPDSIELPL